MLLIASLLIMTAPLAPERAIDIGIKVWQNECAGTVDGLTSWNDGEEFPSLGIGHFIWYPIHRKGPFTETFPALLQFFKEQGVELPRWLEETRGCPWKNRNEFRRAMQQHSKQMQEVRHLLQKTIPLQAQFLQIRLDEALPSILSQVPEEKKNKIQTLYQRIQEHPNGQYVLIDYVNFKGYGTSSQEKYADAGWGLYQVLDHMSDDPQADPIEEFVKSAKFLLEQRVKNAPSIRNEQRYLQGWFFRLDTYATPTRH